MRPSLRFLALIVIGWAGVRMATVGELPGADLFRIDRSEAKPSPPPIVPTEFPPIDPVQPDLPLVAAAAPVLQAAPQVNTHRSGRSRCPSITKSRLRRHRYPRRAA